MKIILLKNSSIAEHNGKYTIDIKGKYNPSEVYTTKTEAQNALLWIKAHKALNVLNAIQNKLESKGLVSENDAYGWRA